MGEISVFPAQLYSNFQKLIFSSIQLKKIYFIRYKI